jgi:hypothetical protein
MENELPVAAIGCFDIRSGYHYRRHREKKPHFTSTSYKDFEAHARRALQEARDLPCPTRALREAVRPFEFSLMKCPHRDICRVAGS